MNRAQRRALNSKRKTAKGAKAKGSFTNLVSKAEQQQVTQQPQKSLRDDYT